MMEMPRCGMPDVYTMEDNGMDMTRKRKRRYALQGKNFFLFSKINVFKDF
jgi:hypothetical protein